MINKIIEFIDLNKENIIAESIKIIDLPSITKNENDVKKCLERVLELGREKGFKSYTSLKKDVGVIEYGDGEETIGVLTHVDVVGIGDIKKWKTDPFKGLFDGRYIIGRGAMDNKTLVISILYSIFALKELNIKSKKKIQLIIGTKEEMEWGDMENYKKEFKLPDYGFTPDGSFPIQNKEKGYADVELEFEKDNSDNEVNIINIKSGDSVNTIPSFGRAEIHINDLSDYKDTIDKISSLKDTKVEMMERNNIKIEVKGVSSHSSLPQNGDNAAEKLIDVLSMFKGLSKATLNFIKMISEISKVKHTEELGTQKDLCYYKGEYIGYTTTVPTVIKKRLHHYIVNINIRHKYGITREKIISFFEKNRKKYRYNYTINNYQDPILVNKNKKFLKLMAESYELITGEKSNFILANGTSYAKSMNNIVSWGPVFPGEKDTCHQENEKIDIDSLIKATKIYSVFLYKAINHLENLS